MNELERSRLEEKKDEIIYFYEFIANDRHKVAEKFRYINTTGKVKLDEHGSKTRKADITERAEARIAYPKVKKEEEYAKQVLDAVKELYRLTLRKFEKDEALTDAMDNLLSNLSNEEQITFINSFNTGRSRLTVAHKDEVDKYEKMAIEGIKGLKLKKVEDKYIVIASTIATGAYKQDIPYYSYQEYGKNLLTYKENLDFLEDYDKYVKAGKIKPIPNYEALKKAVIEKGKAKFIIERINSVENELKRYPNEFLELREQLQKLKQQQNKIIDKANKEINKVNVEQIKKSVEEQRKKEQLESQKKKGMEEYAKLAYMWERAINSNNYDAKLRIEAQMRECASQYGLSNNDIYSANAQGRTTYYDAIWEKEINDKIIRERFIKETQVRSEDYDALRKVAIRQLELSGEFDNIPTFMRGNDVSVAKEQRYREMMIYSKMRELSGKDKKEPGKEEEMDMARTSTEEEKTPVVKESRPESKESTSFRDRLSNWKKRREEERKSKLAESLAENLEAPKRGGR